MGLLRAIKRIRWKKEVLAEFYDAHAIDLKTIQLGKIKLNDILNAEYENSPRNPARGAINITRLLNEEFGISVAELAKDRPSGSV